MLLSSHTLKISTSKVRLFYQTIRSPKGFRERIQARDRKSKCYRQTDSNMGSEYGHLMTLGLWPPSMLESLNHPLPQPPSPPSGGLKPSTAMKGEAAGTAERA